MDHTRTGPLSGQIPHAVQCADLAAAEAKAVSKILSRRRRAAGLADVRKTFRRICPGATWGKKISENIAEIRSLAHAHGRECEIGFGMRLQIICREDEQAAWEAADRLMRHASMAISCCHIFGPASPRCDRAPVSRRSAIPSAEMLQQFIDAGCHSF